MFRTLADALRRFMYGRYRADQLFYALIIIFLVFNVVNRFANSLLITIIQLVIFFYAAYRYFSRNIYRRREENRKFMKIFAAIKNYFSFLRDRIRDRKVCRYRQCKYCPALLRLPIKKGKNTVKCPRCNKSFKVNIWI